MDFGTGALYRLLRVEINALEEKALNGEAFHKKELRMLSPIADEIAPYEIGNSALVAPHPCLYQPKTVHRGS